MTGSGVASISVREARIMARMGARGNRENLTIGISVRYLNNALLSGEFDPSRSLGGFLDSGTKRGF